jgi:Eco29kI restriction endonuclease
MANDPQPYNPLDRVELGKSVERALLGRPLVPLSPLDRFSGAGLYAIYYIGGFPPYSPITPPLCSAGEVPIYVGRARPKGTRQGVVEGLDATTSEPVLFDRLRQHANSIRQVAGHAQVYQELNLRTEDFLCRYLVADDIWVPLGEALLIGHYRPLWNVVVDGFGNHAPGRGRRDQARSPWDELHPGRPWARALPAPKHGKDQILAHIQDHLMFQGRPNLADTPDLDLQVRAALADESEGER